MRYWKFIDRPYVPGQGRTWPEPVSKWTKLGVYWETADEHDIDGKYTGCGWLRTHSNDNLPPEIFTEVDGNGPDGEIIFKLWGEDRHTNSCGIIHNIKRLENSITVNEIRKSKAEEQIDGIDSGLVEVTDPIAKKVLQDVKAKHIAAMNEAADALAKEIPARDTMLVKHGELLAELEAKRNG